ncbi:MAG: FAD-binding oxidoreductase [Candidatus Omnitrophica bacterium]|nr:FAD-binding oxidoreductase [Candidatus Omnitrophota bacterium]
MFHTKAYLRNQYECWGRVFRFEHGIEPVFWRDEAPKLESLPGPLLPYGMGRSYGDVCLNSGGVLLDTSYLNHFLTFDPQTGLLRCEAGVTLFEILDQFVPEGWFLPVTPGTKYVTVGGAIANDVHGKNHHVGGTFGCHVKRLELLRSSGERFLCSAEENAEMFRATIGGLGLTGLILWADIQLKKIEGPWIHMETEKFSNLDEFFGITEASDEAFELTAAWIDCATQTRGFQRGIVIRGNYGHEGAHKKSARAKGPRVAVPFDLPGFCMNRTVLRMFNAVYAGKQRKKRETGRVHYESFFYPLDILGNWNRLYGKKGFYQYQCMVTDDKKHSGCKALMKKVSDRRMDSFLAVLKKCGPIKSPGLLSFPREGIAVAMDFPNGGEKLLKFFKELDAIVQDYDGCVNLSKDARMPPESFKVFYPQWENFGKLKDPKFSSSFWRRVTGEAG